MPRARLPNRALLLPLLQYMPSRSSSSTAAASAAAAAPRPPPPQPLPAAPLPQPQAHVQAEPPPFQPEEWLPNWDQQGAGQAADWADQGYDEYWESDGDGEAGGEPDWQPAGAASSRPPGRSGAAGWQGAGSSQGRGPVLSDVRLFIRNMDPDATQQALIRTFSK